MGSENYTVQFNKDLTGEYIVSVRDDSSNRNEILNQDMKNHLGVDLDTPNFEDNISLGQDDKGRDLNDNLTNIKKPSVTFNAETGLNVDVLFDKGDGDKEKISHDQFSVTDFGKEEPEQEAPAPNIITLAEEDGIKDAEDNPVVGSYAILPGDAEGQSKLVAVEQGDDNAWSPSGETETIVPVQTDALTEITPQEGQSYYPAPGEEEQEIQSMI